MFKVNQKIVSLGCFYSIVVEYSYTIRVTGMVVGNMCLLYVFFIKYNTMMSSEWHYGD